MCMNVFDDFCLLFDLWLQNTSNTSNSEAIASAIAVASLLCDTCAGPCGSAHVGAWRGQRDRERTWGNSRIKRSLWMSLTYCKHLIMLESIRLYIYIYNIECLCKVNMCINHFSQWRLKNFHGGHGKEPSNQRRRPRKTLFKALLYIFVTYSEYACFEWTAAHHNNQNLLSDLGSAVRFWVKWPQVSLCHLHSATDVWSLMIVMETGSAGPVQLVNLRIRVQGSFKSPPTMIKLLDLFEKHSTILYLVSSCFIFQFVSYCFQKLHLFRMSLGLFMGASYLRSGTLIAVKRNVKCATLVRLG